ncbi:putative DNA-binding protein [Sporosarcina sp. BI001-red]|uniref:putative DNA-binding protein n=1 Tax=Sporosarcina sp. BI001-red TaxID=2282866 RepID=UPI000E2833E6|nr:putative DNA-binding protein [Sporosarcina sp. BI001-red]REB09730.1 putative DNA-binding protein [Sporosarcina sp. BI001-red]
MLEKTTRVNFLFDFYQSLLTDKQRIYMELYYLDDLSLGEIAEEYGVSRQAVYDNVRRTEAMLEDYEAKLGLFNKFQERSTLIEQIEQRLSTEKALTDEVQMLLQQIKEHD